MKRHIKYSSVVCVVLILAVAASLFLYSATAQQSGIPDPSGTSRLTVSFIPDEVTEYLCSYMEVCKENPDKTVEYTHFETEIEAEAFSRSRKDISGYEILGAEKVNEDLYGFTVLIQNDYTKHPKRYYFVGRIDGQLRLMVNVGNIPESLKEGFNPDRYTFTKEELNGSILVSPETILNGAE